MTRSKSLVVLLLFLSIIGLSTASAEEQDTGRSVGDVTRDIGHSTKDTAKEIGHGTRDVARKIGHGTRDVTRKIGHGARDTAFAIGHASRAAVNSAKESIDNDIAKDEAQESK